MAVILRSYAKLNLFLEVLNKRKDDYHNIVTLFERIGLSDKITLKPRPDKKIRIICPDPTVPKDSSNLCYRAARLLKENFHIQQGLDIEIEKHIPAGAGLGGGSSNAAAILLGLNRLWKLGLSRNKLVECARLIGSDVSFFLYDTPFARGEGRGDIINPLRLKKLRLWHILVVPEIKVSTALIYKRWDSERRASKLTNSDYDVKMPLLGLRKRPFPLRNGVLSRRHKIAPPKAGRMEAGRDSAQQATPEAFSPDGAPFNSLEAITAKFYPEVRRVKEKLIQLGVKSILMSGSGPAVFGIVSSRKEAVSLARRLRTQERSWRIFATRTC